MEVVTAPQEDSESGENPERYRHCKRGGTRTRRKSVIGRNPEKAVRALMMRKSGDLLECVFPPALRHMELEDVFCVQEFRLQQSIVDCCSFFCFS